MDQFNVAGQVVSPRKTPLLIAGPCVLEDVEDAIRIGIECAKIAEKEGFFYIFKSSYLKDNRSSIVSYTGPGLENGLEMLERIGKETGAPLLTDIHSVAEAAPVAEVCDVLQIPAFLSRQTSLITAAASTGKALNLKKGQFLSPEEMYLAVEKARRNGAGGVMVTERGTFFGYHNLVVDFTSFPRMRDLDTPMIFDATHSLQLPGRLGNRSGGRPGLARFLARAAAAAGCDGLFVETHFEPMTCECDAEVMLPLDDLPRLLEETGRLFELISGFDED
jgi:2-dehydro-3-deoxyphosphooctonate aldolase (KDO 8-P synthase)